MKLQVDRESQREDEADDFLAFLRYNELAIDAWDADSLLLLGTAVFPLQVPPHPSVSRRRLC